MTFRSVSPGESPLFQKDFPVCLAVLISPASDSEIRLYHFQCGVGHTHATSLILIYVIEAKQIMYGFPGPDAGTLHSLTLSYPLCNPMGLILVSLHCSQVDRRLERLSNLAGITHLEFNPGLGDSNSTDSLYKYKVLEGLPLFSTG